MLCLFSARGGAFCQFKCITHDHSTTNRRLRQPTRRIDDDSDRRRNKTNAKPPQTNPPRLWLLCAGGSNATNVHRFEILDILSRILYKSPAPVQATPIRTKDVWVYPHSPGRAGSISPTLLYHELEEKSRGARCNRTAK